MRLVKVRRRSTAHYLRSQPPDAGWAAKQTPPTGSHEGCHLARLVDRQVQLDTMQAEWMRRTLESVVTFAATDNNDNNEGWVQGMPAPRSQAGISDKKLRQLERDRQILVRQHRQRPAGSDLHAASEEDNLLSIKGMLNGRGSVGIGSSSSGSSPVQPQLPQSLQRTTRRRLPQLPPELPGLPPLTGGKLQPMQKQQAPAAYPVALSPRQQQRPTPLRSRLRRPLGGGLSEHHNCVTNTAISAAENLQFLRITGPAGRWPTPIDHADPALSGRIAGTHVINDRMQLYNEQTLLQLRNPVNSPEPEAFDA